MQPVFEMETLFFNMTYRKFYSQKFQITIPTEFDIHHLDFNHDNDDIKNLLLLPKELHERLHKAHREMRMWEIKADAIESYSNLTLIKASMMKEMSEVLIDVAYWLRVKEMELLQIGGEFGYNYNSFRNGGKNC